MVHIQGRLAALTGARGHMLLVCVLGYADRDAICRLARMVYLVVWRGETGVVKTIGFGERGGVLTDGSDWTDVLSKAGSRPGRKRRHPVCVHVVKIWLWGSAGKRMLPAC